MKNYRVCTPKQALRESLNDDEMNWTEAEKNALKKIVDDDDNHGDGCGTGRIWRAKGSKIIFGTHDTEDGYNVWRW